MDPPVQEHPEPKQYMFMTDGTYSGNLVGIHGADGICQTEASEIVDKDSSGSIHADAKGRNWVAYLQGFNGNGYDFQFTRIPLLPRIHRIDGEVLARTRPDWGVEMFYQPIFSASGTRSAEQFFWADSIHDRTGVHYNCKAWKSDAKDTRGAGVRNSSGYIYFLMSDTNLCDQKAPILCVSKP